MGARPDYKELDHTADSGIELTAPTLHAAFESAAAAMFDLICPLDSVQAVETFPVDVEARAGDREALLVRWLAELLYIYESRRVLLCEFSVVEMDDGRLRALASGETFDPERHGVAVELKAPTYHDLVLRRQGDHWVVRVIFDT